MQPRRLLLALLPSLLIACTAQPLTPQPSASRLTTYVYAYQEGNDPKDHVKHTLFIVGDGPSGMARYVAASFKDGARYSLASSGNGSYRIDGEKITVKAGALDATGVIKTNAYVELGTRRFSFAMKM